MQSINRHKIIFIGVFLITILSISLPGCNKFLDRKPLGQYTTDNYPYPEGGGPYDQFIFSAYSNLRDYFVTAYAFVGAISVRSDDADKGSSLFDGAEYGMIAVDNFTLTPSTQLVKELWPGYYALITNCNVVIDKVEKDSINTPEPLKLQSIAEARFLRGYAYFMMVRLYGNIPLIDKVLTVSESNVPQSSPEAIYAFIEQDLQFAAANLPLQWDPVFIGRATRGAANGLLAKVYLYQKKWDAALAAASTVINSGIYNLNTPYDKIFTEEGENSSESLFEIQAYADANHKQDYGCQYTNIQGVRGVGSQDLGWGFNGPSTLLEAAYENGDPRKASTILYCPSTTPTRYGEIFPREPNPRYNMKVYTNPQVRLTVGDRFGWWMNVRILRYADVVLMYAEAANELGQIDEAKAKLEWIRARARAGNNAILKPVTTTDQALLRLAIQKERRIELAMEHERFFDLVRWGIAADVLHAAGKTSYTVGRDEFLPIPQEQIDLSKGVLRQNPGW